MKQLFLSILMLLPLAANAEVFESNGIWYNKQYHSGEIVTLEVVASQGVPYSGDITIPQAVYAGEGTTNSKVTSIGKSAFEGCADLTSITLPSTLESIGEGAFYGCSGLTYVKIPNGVTKICSGAFSVCINLVCVTIPGSVTDIESYAFDYCTSLNHIVSESEQPAPFNITVFDTHDDAYDVYSMATLVVPDGARSTYQTTLGWNNFSNISEVSEQKVRAVHVAKAGTLHGFISDMEMFQIKELSLTGEINGDDLRMLREMAGGITLIHYGGDETRKQTKGSLSSLNIENVNIVAGGGYYLEDMSDMEKPSDPCYRYYSKNNALSEYLFCGCKKLKSIILPNNLMSIERRVFADCSALTSITIPNSVTSIDANPFVNCINLTSIIVDEGNMYFDSRNNCNAIIDKKNQLIVGCKNTIISNSVTFIGDGAFSGCTGLTSIDIPDNVTSIGEAAFYDCTGLVYVALPNSLTSIGKYAFGCCESLTDVYCKAENVPSAGYTPFPENITLYVSYASLNDYKSTEPWSKYKVYGSSNLQATEKCSTPTINIANGRVNFSCETSGVSYRWIISSPSGTKKFDYYINLPITLNVYAMKDGYQNSDVATYELLPGLVGDVDGNGVVNVADHVKLSKIIMGRE